MMLLKKLLLLCMFVMAACAGIQAQCLCADAQFKVLLPGLKHDGKKSNYIIRTLVDDVMFREQQSFFPSEIKGDTAIFSYPTGGGLDSLSFIIESPDEEKRMKITALHMHYDIDYTIDLITFTPGSFLFDWSIIEACLEKQRNTSLIRCGNIRFYQMENPKHDGHFIPRNIRPVDLMLFKTE